MIKSYTHRYLEPSQTVYAITKASRIKAQQLLKQTPKVETSSRPAELFFTRPYLHHGHAECYNVVTAYLSEEFAHHVITTMRAKHAAVKPFKVQDLAYISYTMSMPLVVVVNSYCNMNDRDTVQYDLYYRNQAKLDDDETVAKIMRELRKGT